MPNPSLRASRQVPFSYDRPLGRFSFADSFSSPCTARTQRIGQTDCHTHRMWHAPLLPLAGRCVEIEDWTLPNLIYPRCIS